MTDELACPQLPSSAPGTADFPSPFCGLLSLSLVAGGCWGGVARRAKRCMLHAGTQRAAAGSGLFPSSQWAPGSGQWQSSVVSGQWSVGGLDLDPPAAHVAQNSKPRGPAATGNQGTAAGRLAFDDVHRAPRSRRGKKARQRMAAQPPSGRNGFMYWRALEWV
jgi:hypothetical protein